MMNNLRAAIQSSALGPVQEAEPGTFLQSYYFQPDFIGFSGHFPGYPILPAFIQVFLVLIMAEEAERRPLTILTLEKAKFQKEIHPGQVINIKYREKNIKGKKKIEAALTVAEDQAASFQFTFEEIAE
jgi:3-hydroxyacyl-[acyl-carrier-protein] dehydratase